jgi:hypothetical protein
MVDPKQQFRKYEGLSRMIIDDKVISSHLPVYHLALPNGMAIGVD